MNELRRPGFALACLAVFLCLGAAAPKVPQTPEDLVGSWKLNEDLSQDPRAMRPGGGDRGPRGNGPPPGGGRRRGGGGRSGPPPGGGFGGGEDFQRSPARGQIVAMAGGALSLLIESEGPQLTMISGGDDRLLLFTDGRKVRTEQEGGEEMIRRTRWRDEHLEIETTTGRGRIAELWILTNDRKRIFATVEMEGGRRKMSFKRVWDRVESEKAEASPAR